MEMEQKMVSKFELISVSDFATQYGEGVTPQALYYAMGKGKIDFMRVGKDRIVVMTTKSKRYKPNAHSKRLHKEVTER